MTIIRGKYKQKWVIVSKIKIMMGVEVAKIDGDLIEDIIELRSKSYLDSIKRARENAKMGLVYSFDDVFGYALASKSNQTSKRGI